MQRTIPSPTKPSIRATLYKDDDPEDNIIISTEDVSKLDALLSNLLEVDRSTSVETQAETTEEPELNVFRLFPHTTPHHINLEPDDSHLFPKNPHQPSYTPAAELLLRQQLSSILLTPSQILSQSHLPISSPQTHLRRIFHIPSTPDHAPRKRRRRSQHQRRSDARRRESGVEEGGDDCNEHEEKGYWVGRGSSYGGGVTVPIGSKVVKKWNENGDVVTGGRVGKSPHKPVVKTGVVKPSVVQSSVVTPSVVKEVPVASTQALKQIPAAAPKPSSAGGPAKRAGGPAKRKK
ncbi:hypothetical protein HK097_003505 [Rhizophlyctis rosea]|uniref:Uncharacterized protein n=1 Tax=Rhizophlyctis rosea TaxID=64517 RepID=A0AAD5S2H0_9FUNG|nr:hypothetical protein HK097_003505 [Rhizophlyctis rosea]